MSESELSFKSIFVPFTSMKATHWIILTGLVVYFFGLFNGFVGDDFLQIVSNPQIHSLSNIPSFFLGSTFYNGNINNLAGVYFKPLLLTSFSLIYSIFGINSFWYHFFQLVLHIVNTVFIFFILKKFLKNGVSFLLSILFLIHPINSESVYYISALQEILFFFFGIVSLFIVTRWNDRQSLLIAFILILFSLFSKETGILFLFAINFYIFLFEKKNFKLSLLFSVVVGAIYFILKINAVQFLGNPHVTPIDDLALSVRLLNIPSIIFYYIKIFIYPIQLSWTNHWAYTSFNFNNLVLPIIFEIILLSIGIYIGILIFAKKTRKVFFLYCFFNSLLLSGLLLHSQIIPLDLTVSTRWFYFPIFGLLGIIGISYESFVTNKKYEKYFLVIFSIILILLSLRTFSRSFDWGSESILYNQDLNANKDNYAAEQNIALILYQHKKLQEAKVMVSDSIKRYPRAQSYNLLGLIYFEEGKYPQAREAYVEGLKRGGFQLQYDAMAQLGVFYGDLNENVRFIQYGLEKYPKDSSLWKFLAISEYKLGNIQQAKDAIAQAYRLDKSYIMEQFYARITTGKPLNLSAKNL